MTSLRALIEAAFETTEFQEALVSQIQDHIDYNEVAEKVLEAYEQEITDIAADIACDILS